MKSINKTHNKIIAEYLRFIQNETGKTDKKIIELYGGNISNKILADFGNGLVLCESKDDMAGTSYILIDINDMNDSVSAEEISHSNEKTFSKMW